MNTYNPNKLLIYKENIKYNINSIKKVVGEYVDLMPVIKANAYGIGVDNILPIINELQIEYVAVATVIEAVELRKKYSGKIVVLLQPFKNHIIDVLNNNIIVNSSDIEFLKELDKKANELDKVAIIHLEIDTGMGRTGIKFNDINNKIDYLRNLKNIKIDGISTHFSSSSSDMNYTENQIKKFNEAILLLKENINDINIIHACSSGGILNYKKAYYNMVRPGIMIYGYYPSEEKVLKLKPATKFITQISYVHDVEIGEAIGYNKTVIADKKMRVGIIPFGFADAFMGLESNKGYVLVNNHRIKIIAICMDTMIIDITDFKDIKVDDEVVIWDNINITLNDWGEWTNTSNYEVLSILSNRIERILV